MLNAAIIGYGGIAQTAHVPAFKLLEEKGKARLIAACDVDPKRFSQKIEINLGFSENNSSSIRTYTNLEEMLSKEHIDLIDICLPTHLHARYAIDMLRRGFLVHSEKPMARTSAECDDLISMAKEAKNKLMIGQCLRFSSEYVLLKQFVEEKTYGKPLSAVFRRLSGPPLWAWDNWMMDYARSGGCLMDMHIHDIDAVRFIFNEPKAVSCISQTIYSKSDVAHSRLFYDGMSVLAIGDWSQEGTGFTADYRVAFEDATVILEGDGVTIYPRGGEKPVKPAIPRENVYMKELEYFIDISQSSEENLVNPPESAAGTIRLIEALEASALENGKIIPFQKA